LNIQLGVIFTVATIWMRSEVMIWRSKRKLCYLASGFILQMKNSSGSTLKEKSSRSLSPLSSSGSWTSTSMIHGISQVSFFATLSLVNYHLNHCTNNSCLLRILAYFLQIILQASITFLSLRFSQKISKRCFSVLFFFFSYLFNSPYNIHGYEPSWSLGLNLTYTTIIVCKPIIVTSLYIYQVQQMIKKLYAMSLALNFMII
jgi:hypothetical protein